MCAIALMKRHYPTIPATTALGHTSLRRKDIVGFYSIHGLQPIVTIMYSSRYVNIGLGWVRIAACRL